MALKDLITDAGNLTDDILRERHVLLNRMYGQRSITRTQKQTISGQIENSSGETKGMLKAISASILALVAFTKKFIQDMINRVKRIFNSLINIYNLMKKVVGICWVGNLRKTANRSRNGIGRLRGAIRTGTTIGAVSAVVGGLAYYILTKRRLSQEEENIALNYESKDAENRVREIYDQQQEQPQQTESRTQTPEFRTEPIPTTPIPRSEPANIPPPTITPRQETQRDILAERMDPIVDPIIPERRTQSIGNPERVESTSVPNRNVPIDNSIQASQDDSITPRSSSFKVTSGYGFRTHPIQKIQKFHPGVDISKAQGAPIGMTVEGTVLSVRDNPNGYGLFTDIRANRENKVLRFAHMSEVTVSPGEPVSAGQMIGRMGGQPGTPGAGMSTGPHLHLEVRPGPNMFGSREGTHEDPSIVGMNLIYIGARPSTGIELQNAGPDPRNRGTTTVIQQKNIRNNNIIERNIG